MENQPKSDWIAAVVGAGPAGLYASSYLACQGVEVVIINRDIKPGGLAEYGIFHNKHRMKEGLRKQFRKILTDPKIHYFGNVKLGTGSGLTLDDLKTLGFNAVMVTVGAQGTKWLGLPGEDLSGVYHAKDIVYHYNKLPPYSTMEFDVGNRVALIGVGNVMIDIAHWLIKDLGVEEVTAVARRGPAEIKFTRREIQHVVANLDISAYERQIQRFSEVMVSVGQDPEKARNFILSTLEKGEEKTTDTVFKIEFLSSPIKILGDENGSVRGLEVEQTTLIPRNGGTKAKGTGKTRVLDVDTVVFCIGDKVDSEVGLPVKWNEFVKNPEPEFPIDQTSYEAYDPEKQASIPGVFVSGWAREASSGLVGVARKDGEKGAKSIMQYLNQVAGKTGHSDVIGRLKTHLEKAGIRVVNKEDVLHLEDVERKIAKEQGIEYYKMADNQEMLAVINSRQTQKD